MCILEVGGGILDLNLFPPPSCFIPLINPSLQAADEMPYDIIPETKGPHPPGINLAGVKMEVSRLGEEGEGRGRGGGMGWGGEGRGRGGEGERERWEGGGRVYDTLHFVIG